MVLRQYKLATYGETKRLLAFDEVLCNLLMFPEKLYVYNEEGKRIGRFSITINETVIQDCQSMVVHISNRAFINGRASESIVTGILTYNLKTLEEGRYEATEVQGGGKHERKFYLLRESTKYFFSVNESVCDVGKKRQGTIPFNKSIGLIGEAGNIALMRAIAIRGYEGIICLRTILSNGKRCRNYYVSKKAERVVNGKKMILTVIYRSITDHKKYSITMTSSFTKAGQMIDFYWSNSKYFLHIDPDLEVYERMVDTKGVGLHRHWNRDKQIFSFYLDKKVEEDAFVRSYRLRQQSVKRVVADWIQQMFILKPDDIVCSAINYFTSFGSNNKIRCIPRRKSEEKTMQAEAVGRPLSKRC